MGREFGHACIAAAKFEIRRFLKPRYILRKKSVLIGNSTGTRTRARLNTTWSRPKKCSPRTSAYRSRHARY